MFGSSSNNGGTATGTSGGLFGGSNGQNNGTGGGLFGSKPSGFGAPAASGSTGGLFGGSAANAPAPSFGGQLNSAGGNNTTGGLFGSKPAAPAGGGLFGSSTNTSAGSGTGAAPGGGLFGGSTSSGTTGGGLFGKPAASNTTGGLFGGQQQQQQQQQQQPQQQQQSGGLFGSSAPSTGGLFGSSNAAAPATGGLFGSQQQQQPQQQQPSSGGLFGSNSSTLNSSQPSFGWSSQQSQSQPQQSSQSGLFNNSANTSTTNNNSTNFNNINNSNNINNTTHNNIVNSYTPAINDQLLKIKEKWDPNSPKCALKTHFYNKLSEQESQIASQQPRPTNESPEDWDAAMQSRPSHLYYPIKITSFTEVAQRIEVQLDHVAKSRVILKEIDDKQSQLSSKHDLNNTTRILKAKSKHTQLLRRLLRLATVLAILKLKGYPLLPEEEEISKQFEILNAKLSDPSSPLGKMNDVFARLAILKDRLEDLAYQFDSNIKAINEDHEATSTTESEGNSNDETIQKLSKLLLKLQIGLNHLNGVLEKDMDVVDRIQRR